jgi:hypothetical protein
MWDILKIFALSAYLAGGSVFNVVFRVHEPKVVRTRPEFPPFTVFIKSDIAVMCPN